MFLIIDFYQVGVHENVYAELKQYLRQEKPKQPQKDVLTAQALLF
jgi:hypothetical protein